MVCQVLGQVRKRAVHKDDSRGVLRQARFRTCQGLGTQTQTQTQHTCMPTSTAMAHTRRYLLSPARTFASRSMHITLTPSGESRSNASACPPSPQVPSTKWPDVSPGRRHIITAWPHTHTRCTSVRHIGKRDTTRTAPHPQGRSHASRVCPRTLGARVSCTPLTTCRWASYRYGCDAAASALPCHDQVPHHSYWRSVTRGTCGVSSKASAARAAASLCHLVQPV